MYIVLSLLFPLMVTDMLDPPPSLTELEGRIDALESRIERLERVLEDSDTEAKESAGDNNSDIYSEGKPEGVGIDGAANVTNGNGDNNDVPRDGDSSPSAPTDGDVGLLPDKGAKEEASEEIEEKAKVDAKSITFEATAYTADCEGCTGITKTGVDVRNSTHYEGKRVIAVDPAEIPLGSEVIVTLADGTSFEATAQDTGGAIKGRRIDVLVASRDEAYRLGRQTVKVEILK